MKLFKTLMTASVLAGTALAPVLAQAAAVRIALPFTAQGAAGQMVAQVDFKFKSDRKGNRGWGKGGNSNSNSDSNSNSSSNSSSDSDGDDD